MPTKKERGADPALQKMQQLRIYTRALLDIVRFLNARPSRRKLLERMEAHLLESGDWVRRPGWKKPRRMQRHQDLGLWHAPKASRPRCGAKTRQGTPCRAPVVWGRLRCRLHGGKSTGPKTPEGRARIAESNRRRAQLRQRGHQEVIHRP